MQRLRFVIGFVLIFGVFCASSLASQQKVGGRDVTPRETVVLLHGLGRGKTAMWLLASRIEQAGFRVIRVGYDSLRETPQAMLVEVARQIDLCCAALQSSVHFVGHSLGGLLIRAYLAEHEVTHLGRVVLIGTPNYEITGHPFTGTAHGWCRRRRSPSQSQPPSKAQAERS